MALYPAQRQVTAMMTSAMAALALSNHEMGARPTDVMSLLMMPKSALNISRNTAA
nr:hypothetical protein RP007_05325 [Rhizobium sp. P007]